MPFTAVDTSERHKWRRTWHGCCPRTCSPTCSASDLAVSRCVCRAWRALVDDLAFLRTELLPLLLADIFLCFATVENHKVDYPDSKLFAPPPPPPADITYSTPREILDTCNGLILECDTVFNPATGGRAPLPEPSDSTREGEAAGGEVLRP